MDNKHELFGEHQKCLKFLKMEGLGFSLCYFHENPNKMYYGIIASVNTHSRFYFVRQNYPQTVKSDFILQLQQTI